jgi:multicomponent Na+:H+ antiporter subunit E
MTHREHATPGGRVRRFLIHWLPLALLWWVLVGARWDSWGVGAPVTLLAAAASLGLSDERRGNWRLRGMLGLASFFLRRSLVGGIDVARRSLHPRLPIDPQNVEFPLSLPAGTSRVVFMGMLNLLPGTVTVDLCGDTLLVHVIDAQQPAPRQLRELEKHVAAAFGVESAAPERKGGSR